MEISFATPQLKETCLARSVQTSPIPINALNALHVLYNAMRNAEHLDELPLGSPEPADLKESLEWTVDLGDQFQVRLRIAHLMPPIKNGTIDLGGVRRVQVIAIEGPNG